MMSKPSLRFLQLVAAILGATWLASMVGAYMFGSHGLHLPTYITRVFWVGMNVFFGFLLVWMAARLIRRRLEAYVPTTPLSIAAPVEGNISPLESDLIGRLNAHSHWPAHPPSAATNLPDQALRRWRLIRGLPDTTPLHGVLALASALGPLMAFSETRVSAPWWNLTQRDTVTLTPVAPPSGPLAAGALVGFPAFQALSPVEQELLVTALRHMDSPLPSEAPAPLADMTAKLQMVIGHVG